MSRPGPSARNLTLTEELEKLEQSITLTLQEIDSNFSKAHRIVTTSILPIVEQYGENSRNVWEASKFWKQFFEASANVSLSGYEELANDEDETAAIEESTVQDETSVNYTPRRENGAEDESTASAAESTFQAEESMIGGDDDLTGSTPRLPKTKTIQTQFSSLESPYEALKRELKGEPPAPHEEDDEDEDLGIGEDSTILFAQHTARLPDMSMTPRTSLAPAGQQSAQPHKDPLMHRMLDKTFRIQATPHKGPTYRVSPLKREAKPKEEEDVPTWKRQDSPMSSPVMAVPTLRSEAFMSPTKSRRLAAVTAAAGPRTPGVSVQTPVTGRKTKDVFASKPIFRSAYDDDTTTTDMGAAGLAKDKYEINWESDSDEEQGLYGGMSPPKTIQFALPQSKLLQTPAREASKRIVDDILMTAGAEPESPEYSPTMVKMNEDILDESF